MATKEKTRRFTGFAHENALENRRKFVATSAPREGNSFRHFGIVQPVDGSDAATRGKRRHATRRRDCPQLPRWIRPRGDVCYKWERHSCRAARRLLQVGTCPPSRVATVPRCGSAKSAKGEALRRRRAGLRRQGVAGGVGARRDPSRRKNASARAGWDL